MALNGTMVKIDTVTVGSGGAANIEFTNIPQTFDDLVVKFSARITANDSSMRLRINGSSSSIYSGRYLFSSGSGSPVSGSWSASTNDNFIYVNGSATTASTFSNVEIYFPNYRGSTNKSYSTDQVTENNGTTAFAVLTAGLFSSTSPITSLLLYYTGSSNDIAQHSTATLYGISRTTAQIKATGGMVYDTDTHVYHLFNTSGVFTPTQALTVEYLVIAGGGGGGANMGGGGGAGGYLESSTSLTASTNYTVTVGAGGASSTSATGQGGSGNNSIFGSITATGGGGGGGNQGASGANGGSGGGGGSAGIGIGTTGQGNNGGSASYVYPQYGGGGGGGAGAAGTNGTGTKAGNGGVGTASSITGTSVTRAGGGGGGYLDNFGAVLADGADGGAGGGGAGGVSSDTTALRAASSGTANTGGGGGGGGWLTGSPPGNGTSGAGGSGIIIVRYAK
jgi:hypothetical protein